MNKTHHVYHESSIIRLRLSDRQRQTQTQGAHHTQDGRGRTLGAHARVIQPKGTGQVVKKPHKQAGIFIKCLTKYSISINTIPPI